MQTSAPGRRPTPQLALGLDAEALQPGPLAPESAMLGGWPEDLRALTLTAPWGFAMTQVPEPDRKMVENRTWAPIPAVLQHGWFMLHSGADYDREAAEWISRRTGGPVPTKSELRASGRLGTLIAFARLVRLTEVLAELPEAQVKWRMTDNRYGWLLDARPLEKPVACPGWHKLWRVAKNVTSGELRYLRDVFGEMKLAESPLREIR